MKSVKLSDNLKKWEVFKKDLPHMNKPFSKKNWGSDLHSVCSYQGKMKPALAYHLVETFSIEGDVILDPFSGSGTIPFEAAINGRVAFGLDIGLMATSVSNAKLKKHNYKEVFLILDMLNNFIRSHTPQESSMYNAKKLDFNKTIPEYFHKNTFREILLAREFFLKYKNPESENWSLVFACMLHILHGNRPYALSRNSHSITPYAPTGDFIYKNLIEKLTNKVNKSIVAQELLTLSPAKCFLTDILDEWPSEIQNVNAIITSPPFFDSTKFYMTNWMRYWFCGWDRKDFQEKSEAFVEVIQRKKVDIYDLIFKKSYERLVCNGISVFHLGYSKKIDMAKSLVPFAEKYFHIIDVFTESVDHCEKHGIKDKGSVKGHQYLVLIKK